MEFMDILNEMQQPMIKSRKRAFRRKMNMIKFERAKEICKYARGHGAGWIDCDYQDGKWVEVGKYMKYPKSSRRAKFLKRRSNKIIRNGDHGGKGSYYKKSFDYWWELI